MSSEIQFFVDLFGFLIKNHSVEENDSAIEKVKTQLVKVERALVESEITVQPQQTSLSSERWLTTGSLTNPNIVDFFRG